jgi:pentatricopeptide repeat protein
MGLISSGLTKPYAQRGDPRNERLSECHQGRLSAAIDLVQLIRRRQYVPDLQ